MVNVGDCLKVKTTTKDDVFGTCYYEVLETGMPSPERGRNDNDGIKCIMLGGSGPAAHSGLVIHDSQMKVGNEVKNGTTQVISKEQALTFISLGATQLPGKAPGDGTMRPATGVIEME